MSRPRYAPALAGVALCSLLATGCSGGGVPNQSETRGEVFDELVAQGIDTVPAGEVADCVSRGLFESGDFTKEERDATLSAHDGEPPDPELVDKVDGLVDGCAEEAGVEIPGPILVGSEDEDSTTTSTAG